jgi:uncharacterized repeat protein (TIGR03809 family)
MTQRLDAARGRDVLARWCNLAEQRLEYLTELFETGRWRRFHSEIAFLENIREAKAAVETWRDLLSREASLDNSAIDMSWLDRTGATSRLRGQTANNQPLRLAPAPVSESPPRRIAVSAVESDRVSLDPVFSMPAVKAPALAVTSEMLPDIDAIGRRYPLLRNAL